MWIPNSFSLKQESGSFAANSNQSAWLILLVSGLFEAVWATALGNVEGPHKAAPISIFLVGLSISMGGLGWSMSFVPTGTAYAVWTAVGGVATVSVSVLWGTESMDLTKFVFLSMIVGGVVGLKMVSKLMLSTVYNVTII